MRANPIAPIYTRMILNAAERIQTFKVRNPQPLMQNIRYCLHRRGYRGQITLAQVPGTNEIVAYKKEG